MQIYASSHPTMPISTKSQHNNACSYATTTSIHTLIQFDENHRSVANVVSLPMLSSLTFDNIYAIQYTYYKHQRGLLSLHFDCFI